MVPLKTVLEALPLPLPSPVHLENSSTLSPWGTLSSPTTGRRVPQVAALHMELETRDKRKEFSFVLRFLYNTPKF